MKLRNKKTGEIREVADVIIENMNKNGSTLEAISIDEIKEEWEEYVDEIYYINSTAHIMTASPDGNWDDEKEIGNYFETKKEAELAVEKLKAWKRLKDKGFRLKMWEWEYIYDDNMSGELTIKAHINDATDSDGKYTKDLDLLFGGEE